MIFNNKLTISLSSANAKTLFHGIIVGVLLISCCLLNNSVLYAQQDPQFNQYLFNPLIINPAYAGSRDAFSAAILHRSQWVGFDGAPSTQTVAVHAPLQRKKVGVGLNILTDKIGPTRATSIMGSYAYRLRLRSGKIAFGLRAGMYNYYFDWDRIEYKDRIDVYDKMNYSNVWVPSFDFGVRYNTNHLHAGVAVSHINQPTIRAAVAVGDTFQYGNALNPHAILTAGYAHQFNKNFVLKPSVMIKTIQYKRPQADINISAVINKNLTVGISYRTSYGMMFISEYLINEHLRAGYSFDFTFGALRVYQSGSHEFFIGYDINLKRSPFLSPRYF